MNYEPLVLDHTGGNRLVLKSEQNYEDVFNDLLSMTLFDKTKYYLILYNFINSSHITLAFR